MWYQVNYLMAEKRQKLVYYRLSNSTTTKKLSNNKEKRLLEMRIEITEQFLTEDFIQFPTPESIICDESWAAFSSAHTSMFLCS